MYRMYRMYGIAQRAMDGGALTSKDGSTDICSCNICTSTIPGGRMSQRARDLHGCRKVG